MWIDPAMGDLQVVIAREALESARIAMEDQRVGLEAMAFNEWTQLPVRGDLPELMFAGSGSAYDSGISSLSRRDYERAITRFEQVIEQKSVRADGAMYHKAYALYRLGRASDATTTLAELKKAHAKSAYLKDATVLEAALRESAGQDIDPEQADDDELKLLALNALQHTDPERALPLLEGVLKGANSLKLKQRAIFVLAQSAQPRAREVLMSIAKGGANPDLQRYAIRYVGTGSKKGATSAELRAIYDSTSDADIKRAVIQAWGQSGDLAALGWAASSGNDVAIRSTAVSQISSAGRDNTNASQELWSLYQKEQDRDLKMTILSRLGSLGAADRLSEVIKSEREPEIRRRAIRSLGSMRSDKSGATLADLYTRESDADNKKAIISALGSQNNGEALVAIARKESNMALKREIVSRLSNMSRNKAAMDYMLEIIK
ncbi:MAG: HEAT repeat domain-containing protein [Acidobacteria bacterium]|nr:HEAT repeat domain-containing protein [Acidobacteriota bacterium]